ISKAPEHYYLAVTLMPLCQLTEHRHHRGDAGSGRAEDDVPCVRRVEDEEAVRTGQIYGRAERQRHQVVGRLAFRDHPDDEAELVARIALRGNGIAAARDRAGGV